MISEPQTKVLNGLILPTSAIGALNISFKTSGPSPAKMRIGASKMALREFMYQDKARALPLTTLRLCLMTTECMAVMAELATPNKTPATETGVPSKKTPIKKPKVTMRHAKRILRDGRA